MHEITAGHRSLSGTISCVTDRIRFLPVTMTDRFSNFNSISYTEDRHKLRVTGTRYRLPDTKSGTGEISISGAVVAVNFRYSFSYVAARFILSMHVSYGAHLEFPTLMNSAFLKNRGSIFPSTGIAH